MDSIRRLQDITSRIEHLENAAEWIARENVHQNNGVSQTATLISVLADEIRERVYDLVKEFEEVHTISIQ
jgi:hypothetical protein